MGGCYFWNLLIMKILAYGNILYAIINIDIGRIDVGTWLIFHAIFLIVIQAFR